MPDAQDRQLDRYLAGELSRPEQHELAQAALDDPELFDMLTSAAVVKAAVKRDTGASVHRVNKARVAWTLAGVAAAAAAVVALVMGDRSPSNSIQPPTSDVAAVRRPGAEAVTQPTQFSFQPKLLTVRLDDLAGQPAADFRSAATASRPPKSDGLVIAVEDGAVTVDLGSLDGLAKGSEVRVFRGPRDAAAVGRLTIATVFRESSRGRAASAESPQVGDRVEVPPAIQIGALLEQVLARIAAGDLNEARGLAARASELSGLPATGADVAESMNELGAVLIRFQDYPEAERILRRAHMLASGATGVRVANNLAAVAALRGDPAAAEAMYRSALTLAGNSPEHEFDRRAIAQNLQGLRSSR